jgi:ABC-type multidrug transport system ATPase subunit
VDTVSVDIPAGQSVALWGANGAGKTTLIRCVLGLVAFRGTILVDGLDARRSGKRVRMRIGYVPQELGFYDDLRVREAVALFARLKRLAAPDTDGVLERVGIAGHGGKRIRELSGGMKQRLALAIALLGDPPVLVLDEVTASLDAWGRQEFVSLLSRLSGTGRTMLFASHRIDEVATLAQRVVSLESGRVVRECDARTFVGSLHTHATLHLSMADAARDAAIGALARSGFDPRRNGTGLLVPVPMDQKAGPIRVLAEARIPIDDFDIIAAAPHARPDRLDPLP